MFNTLYLISIPNQNVFAYLFTYESFRTSEVQNGPSDELLLGKGTTCAPPKYCFAALSGDGVIVNLK